jgi:hypothetical protein
MPEPADPSSLLEKIRERAEAASETSAQLADAAIEAAGTDVPEVAARPAILARLASSFDVPPLLAALEAVLKLADNARSVREEYEVDTDSFRDTAWNLDPAKVCEAITDALTGKENSNG